MKFLKYKCQLLSLEGVLQDGFMKEMPCKQRFERWAGSQHPRSRTENRGCLSSLGGRASGRLPPKRSLPDGDGQPKAPAEGRVLFAFPQLLRLGMRLLQGQPILYKTDSQGARHSWFAQDTLGYADCPSRITNRAHFHSQICN